MPTTISIPLPQVRPGTRLSPVSEAGPRSMSAVRMLRISVTDRCNFRCTYCMPAGGVPWLRRDEILSFEEIESVARVATQAHGVTHLKLTGGEPTVRRGLVDLVKRLAALPGVEDLSMTTNGFSLVEQARPLRVAGLGRVTISLDSLRSDRFTAITRTGQLHRVLAGLDAAQAAGFDRVKLNCVVVRGTNDDEIADFARLTLDRPITVRFIEYMPMGESAVLASAGGNPFEAVTNNDTTSFRIADEEQGPAGGCGQHLRGDRDVFVSEAEMHEQIREAIAPLQPVNRSREPGVGPAKVWRLPGAAGRVGFISAMSRPFCETCNRLRLTATGVLRSCLFEGGEVDLRPMLRHGGDLGEAMVRCVALKPDVHSAQGNIQMSRIGG
ncbi:MAG: GTP 3',8-cyclase MoaA [Planctomycetota bacterium]